MGHSSDITVNPNPFHCPAGIDTWPLRPIAFGAALMRDCEHCVYATKIWNGQPDTLVCTNYPGHGGELSYVAGGAVATDCRRFSRRREEPAAVVTVPDESVRYISLGEGKSAMVDAADFEWLNRYKWRTTGGSGGYARSTIGGKNVAMHRLIMNASPGLVVDHINGNIWDNRRHNLRVCTVAQNARNRRSLRGTSRFKGVSWNARCHKWRAAIYCMGKKIRLGDFENEIEAARAYDRKAKELFGQFAYLNFPNEVRYVYLSGRIRVRGEARAWFFKMIAKVRRQPPNKPCDMSTATAPLDAERSVRPSKSEARRTEIPTSKRGRTTDSVWGI